VCAKWTHKHKPRCTFPTVYLVDGEDTWAHPYVPCYCRLYRQRWLCYGYQCRRTAGEHQRGPFPRLPRTLPALAWATGHASVSAAKRPKHSWLPGPHWPLSSPSPHWLPVFDTAALLASAAELLLEPLPPGSPRPPLPPVGQPPSRCLIGLEGPGRFIAHTTGNVPVCWQCVPVCLDSLQIWVPVCVASCLQVAFTFVRCPSHCDWCNPPQQPHGPAPGWHGPHHCQWHRAHCQPNFFLAPLRRLACCCGT
jgi:hypothetical protein